MTIIDSMIDKCKHIPIETEQAIVCRICGLVLDKKYEQTTMFKRRFDGDDSFIIQNHHIPMPFKVGSRTEFDPYKASKNKQLFYRLRQYNKLEGNSAKVRLARLFLPVIKQVCQKYGLSKYIEEEISNNLLKFQQTGKLKGRRAKVYLYALVHISCTLHNHSHFLKTIIDGEERTFISPLFKLRTIADIEELSPNHLNRAYYHICEVLDINNQQYAQALLKEGKKEEALAEIQRSRVKFENRVDDIIRSLEEAELSHSDFREKIIPYIAVMKKLYEKSHLFHCKDSIRVIGTFIYLFQEKLPTKRITQRFIAEVMAISEISLRNYIKEVKKLLADEENASHNVL